MNKKPKLIMLNGAAAVGKTTIAGLYTESHPLTLNFTGDVLIEMISGWRDSELEARELVFGMMRNSVEFYLESGHDVVVQYLLTDAAHAAGFAEVAVLAEADFYEVMLTVDKETALRRLFKRGVWGEENSHQLTEKDIPEAEKLYDTMVEETSKRKDTIMIPVIEGEIEETYQAFLEAVGESG